MASLIWDEHIFMIEQCIQHIRDYHTDDNSAIKIPHEQCEGCGCKDAGNGERIHYGSK